MARPNATFGIPIRRLALNHLDKHEAQVTSTGVKSDLDEHEPHTAQRTARDRSAGTL